MIRSCSNPLILLNISALIIYNLFISLNNNVIEFSIPFTVLFENGEVPFGEKIALVAIIGGGADDSYADDTIPQVKGGFTGNFTTVFSSAY